MILYLARNESANLLDRAAKDKSLHIRKLSGNFSLSEFIIKDMRKFASCRFFCVERLAITEKDGAFLEAVKSFQMMSDARIIVIHENTHQMEHMDSLTRELVKIGVTDSVTAHGVDEKHEEIDECLSESGLMKYRPKPKKPVAVKARVYDDYEDSGDEDCGGEYVVEPDEEEKETLARSIILKEMEDEYYRFDCLNIKIGIIGATRRVGVTTFALGLVSFIKNHGGTACYVALNTNGHLESIAGAYGFDIEGDYYTYDAIDFYEGMLPKHDYNFVIMDYGDMKREAIRKYKESDVHLFCGASDKPFEVAEFAEALRSIKSVKPAILTYAPTPDCARLFNSAVTKEPTIIKPVKNMLDYKINGIAFKDAVQEHIVETSKRL
jgi:hypothetical protein